MIGIIGLWARVMSNLPKLVIKLRSGRGGYGELIGSTAARAETLSERRIAAEGSTHSSRQRTAWTAPKTISALRSVYNILQPESALRPLSMYAECDLGGNGMRNATASCQLAEVIGLNFFGAV